MNRPLDHLTDALVDRYIRQGTGTAFEMEDASIEAHLSSCGGCLDRVLQAQRVHLGLLEADSVNRAPYPNCPEEQVLQELAAGICSRELAAPTLQHAAQCNHCGPLLNRYLDEFSEGLGPEDQAILNQLATGKPEWQERFVREQGLGTLDEPKKRSLFSVIWQGNWWPKMALAGAVAALILAVIAGPGLWAKFELYRADRLIARAYGERRTIEMRTSNAPFSKYDPYPVVRDGRGGREPDYKRPAFAKAEGAVAEKVKSGDGQWLWRQGQLSLIDTASDSLETAQEFLEKAKANGVNDPGLEIDLAVAYFERDAKVQPPNLKRTIELLNQVLKEPKLSRENRAAALFDLGIAYEKTQAWNMAVPTWEDYLRADASSPWADQARLHLREAKAKQLPPRQQGYDRPEFFLSHLSDAAIQRDLEEYQDIAVSQWLPQAVTDPHGDAHKAAMELADLLDQQHSDSWLKDFLASLHSDDLPAVEALSSASKANHKDNDQVALKTSVTAANSFADHKNIAGELRARVEEVYAWRRALKGSDCLALAGPLWQRLSGTHYRWLQGQLLLERGECENLQGEFTESDQDLRASRKLSLEFRFPVLTLRNIGISAGMKRLQGKYDESWKEVVEGLGLYWESAFPQAERLYQFYAVLFQCAADTGSLHAAEEFVLRAMEIQKNQVDPIRTGLLHLHHANILLALGDYEAVQSERRSAYSLLAKPGESYPEQFRLYAEIEPAEFQLKQGNADLALVTLDQARRLLPGSQDKFFPLNFNRVAGNIHLHLGHLDDAAAYYESAIEIAETSLGAIADNYRRLQWIKATQESYRGLVQVLMEQHKEETALGLWEWYKDRPWLQGQPAGIDTKEVSWAAIQKTISKQAGAPAGETRLVYAGLKDHLAIWLITNQGVQTKWLSVKQQSFQDAVHDFAEKCASPDSSLSEVREQGQKLYSLMLTPITALLPNAATVVIELDPDVTQLPVEALSAPDGQYFAQKHSIVYSPGILVERNLRAFEAIHQQEPLLLVDASHFNEGERLPGSEMERKTISQAFPHTTIIDGNTTNSMQIRQALLTATGFHYMGHAVRDGAGSDLLLNHNLSLNAKFFSAETLKRTRMAVLAACSSGVGKENGLLDTDNLVHSFLLAGVPSVIASHWNVDSASTSRLMSSFYTNLSKGENVALAIHNARNEVLTTQSHPYYWAGFNLAGRAN